MSHLQNHDPDGHDRELGEYHIVVPLRASECDFPGAAQIIPFTAATGLAGVSLEIRLDQVEVDVKKREEAMDLMIRIS